MWSIFVHPNAQSKLSVCFLGNSIHYLNLHRTEE